jgi:hypothetical protein
MTTKSIFFLVLFIVFKSNAQFYVFKKNKPGQKIITQFSKDQDGKIIFYEVVTVDTVPRDTLWKNARKWMYNLVNEKDDKINIDEYLSGSLECQTSYMVYISSIISKMPHGKISYNISVDIKDRKYRYTFSNFSFQFYKQDRKDFKYYPVKGSIKPLEKEKYPGYQSAWNGHRADLKKRIEGQIQYLKQEIVKKSKPILLDTAKQKTIIKTKEW